MGKARTTSIRIYRFCGKRESWESTCRSILVEHCAISNGSLSENISPTYNGEQYVLKKSVGFV